VVDAFDVPGQGTGKALLNRAQQVMTTLEGAKELLGTFHKANLEAPQPSESLANQLNSKYSHLTPLSPMIRISSSRQALPSPPLGLQSLISELTKCDAETAKSLRDLWAPEGTQSPLQQVIHKFGSQIEVVNNVHGYYRLGTHQQNEMKLCASAVELNMSTQHLKAACLRPLASFPPLQAISLNTTLLTPVRWPCIIFRNANWQRGYKMKSGCTLTLEGQRMTLSEES
jgi:hypothetical protein